MPRRNSAPGTWEHIEVDVERRGIVAVDVDDAAARYDFTEQIHASVRSTGAAPPLHKVRAIVEVQRRFGGIAPRALLGGRFIAGAGDLTEFDVHVSRLDMLDSVGRPTVSSRLWSQPFVVGLPIYLASGVMRGLTESGTALPPGVLIVDRAGFDVVNSAEPVFAEAASVLAAVLAAILYERELEPEIRKTVAKW